MERTLFIDVHKTLHVGALRVHYHVPVPGSDETELHADDGKVWLVANADLWEAYQGRPVRAQVRVKRGQRLEGGSARPAKKQVAIKLTAQANVKGTLSLTVPYAQSDEAIRQQAREHFGDVSWEYNGCIEGTEEVGEVAATGEVWES